MSIIQVKDLDFFYGRFQALKKISLNIDQQKITALIGPSGCGKTTFLRSLNRMNDLIEDVHVGGRVLIDSVDIYEKRTDLLKLRKRVGMVFQRPNPFPLSIFNNVSYGLRVHGVQDTNVTEERVQRSLESVHLWTELKDKLKLNALCLSGEQQQRLCISRLIEIGRAYSR